MTKRNRTPLNKLLPLIIFLSGFAALVYQIVWIREFSLLFGTHLLSTSTVLTVFMTGLSAGALLFGYLADRWSRPLKLLLLIQAGIALFAFLFTPLFHLVTNIYTSINQSDAWLSNYSNLSRFILSFLVLIIPTTLMGGMLPLTVKLFTANLGHIGNRAGRLYTLNNAGAFLGGLLAGFFLLRLAGSYHTNLIAAFVNSLNVILIILLLLANQTAGKVTAAPAPPSVSSPPFHLTQGLFNLVIAVTAVEGFTMLVYEILWTRSLLEFSYDKSSYVYTIVILGFLSGLSAGSFVIRNRIDRWKNLTGKFSVVETGAGLAALLSFILFSWLSPVMYHGRLVNDTWFHVSGEEYLFFFFNTALPAFLMGISYPLTGKIINDNPGKIGSRMGLLSFADTIGSVAGPAIAGFVMLRYLNIYQCFLICVFLNIGSGIALAAANSKAGRNRHKIISLSGLVIAVLVLMIYPESKYFAHKASFYPGDKILDLREGMTATVAVTKERSGYMALSINGAKTAFTNPEDQRVHKMLAYLPWFLHPDAKNAAVIGYGLGITTRCLNDLGLRITLAELSPEVLNISTSRFGYLNHRAVGSENVTTFVEDGRSVLLRSKDRFGIITSNAVHPRLGSNLYSEDFYKLCNERLTENGIICQWIPTNWMSEDEFKSLIKAFTNVFPNCVLWYVNRSHTLIAGSGKPIDINYNRIRSLFYRRDIYYDLIDVDLNTPEAIMAGFFTTGRELRQWVNSSRPDTDDRPVIEYSFVTDPRPNQNVLSTLVKLQPDFRNLIHFSDTIPENEKSNVINLVETDYRSHIAYLKNLNLNLAAEDSLRTK